jgi:type I restriction enzyme S subunit
MIDWEELLLKDIAQVQQGFAFKSQDFNNNAGIPVIKIKNISSGEVNLSDVQYYNNKTGQNLEKYQVTKGDVLIAMTGSHLEQPNSVVGKVSLYRSNLTCLLNQRTAKFIPRKNTTKLFLYYCLKQDDVLRALAGNASGSANQANISSEQISNLPILCPPLKEQQAIAEVLSSIDDKIDLLHRNNKTLEEMAGTLFKSMTRDSSNESITSVLLHQIADINPETINSKFRNEHSEIEYLDTGSVTKGQINGFQTISIDKAPSRAQRVVRKGDIIYSIVRPVQRHYALLDEVKANSIASTGFAVIRPKVNCHFIYQLLTSDESVEFLDMIAEASTSTYPSLKPSDIANFEIALPGEEALEQFHQQAELMQEKVNKNYRQINELIELRNLLLPKLMSGTVTVNL